MNINYLIFKITNYMFCDLANIQFWFANFEGNSDMFPWRATKVNSGRRNMTSTVDLSEQFLVIYEFKNLETNWT